MTASDRAAVTAGNPPERLLVVAKRDCPTCTLIEPVLEALDRGSIPLTVYSQDDPGFPAAVSDVVDDTELEHSFRLETITVPTLVRLRGDRVCGRTEGWDREAWRGLTGVADLGAALPAFRPGCGSRSVEPGMSELLQARFGTLPTRSRMFDVPVPRDPIETCFERGWSDGLPVVPPTPERVLRMLAGTTRAPDEVLGRMPPDYHPCTVEKVAINAVLAGCRPEYLPVVLAAVEAALEPDFAMHGLLCTTYFSGPVVVVNGPMSRRIDMNCGVNALGQGNRANATIGRALQLVVRNVGGGVPGGIDRATLGQPGKLTFCFAEDESDPEWQPLHASRGIGDGRSAVTLFGGDGVIPCMDEGSRSPESLARSLATTLNVVGHPKRVLSHDAMLVLSPEHYAIFRDAGWDRGRIEAAVLAATARPGDELVRGARGIEAGLPPESAAGTHVKFRPGGLLLVRAGGPAGLMSAVIGGWAATGARGSEPITREITA